MNLEEDLALSYYKELSSLNSEHGVHIVQHIESKQIYVIKKIQTCHVDVYRQLQSHPIKRIPEIQELIETPDHLILIEQYISGKTLEEYMQTETVSTALIRSIMLSLCEIVCQLHAMNPAVIHRDIKPSNIIITPQCDIWLLDFNAAKPFSTDKDSDTVLIGTHGYAAPEQYGFAPSSPQTDIFALGMVLKDLAEAASLQTSIYDSIIEKCIRLDPKDRYASVSDLMKALKHPDIQNDTSQLDSSPEKGKTSLENSKNWKSYLFPGLSSKYLILRIVSFIGYLCLAMICFYTNFKNVLPVGNWVERFLEYLLFLAPVLVVCNYRNIQNRFPPCRSRNRFIRLVSTLLFAAGLTAFIFLLMILVMAAWSIPNV